MEWAVSQKFKKAKKNQKIKIAYYIHMYVIDTDNYILVIGLFMPSCCTVED